MSFHTQSNFQSQVEKEAKTKNSRLNPAGTKNVNRIKVAVAVLTVFGIVLFMYFVYTVGVREILAGISRFGFDGFAVILFIYLLRISARATAWRMSVAVPNKLRFRDTLPAVMIGEALVSIIPLGVLLSGTAKAVAVRKRIPLVVGLSSVVTENLFYSLITGLFVCFGAFAFLRGYDLPETSVYLIDFLIVAILITTVLGILMVIRQWHWASGICNFIYRLGLFKRVLNKGRAQVRLFENLIYGFYRKHPRRFVPISALQVLFHGLGVFEVWFILTRISSAFPTVSAAFFLESISRLVTIIFKLVPFLVGVDEAGAQFVAETMGIGFGIGVTLAIIRKGRILFWAAIGMMLIVKRGFSFKDLSEIRRIQESKNEA